MVGHRVSVPQNSRFRGGRACVGGGARTCTRLVDGVRVSTGKAAMSERSAGRLATELPPITEITPAVMASLGVDNWLSPDERAPLGGPSASSSGIALSSSASASRFFSWAFSTELLEPLGVVRLRPAVLRHPALPGRLGDLHLSSSQAWHFRIEVQVRSLHAA